MAIVQLTVIAGYGIALLRLKFVILSPKLVAYAELLSRRLVIFLNSNSWSRLKVVNDRSRSAFAQGSFQDLLDWFGDVPRNTRSSRCSPIA